MNKPTPKNARVTAPAPPTTDAKGNLRVYIDLPTDVVRRFNVLAAMRGVPKRTLLAEIVRLAVADVKI